MAAFAAFDAKVESLHPWGEILGQGGLKGGDVHAAQNTIMDGLKQGADDDMVEIWQKMNAKCFDNSMLNTKTVGACATPEGIEVTFAPAVQGGAAPVP